MDLLLFITYNVDLIIVISNYVTKFEDDTKISGVIQSDQESGVLQNDLDGLYDWKDKWEMEFHLVRGVART